VTLSYWARDNIYVIFEAGLNHNGDPEMALQLVEAAAACGADAVKFQKRDISSLATRSMLNSAETRFPSLGNTYREVRSKLELPKDVYLALKKKSHELGLHFMVTPFDSASLRFILEVGVDSIKVASHSVANPRLLLEIAKTKLPVVMSSGMVSLEELDRAVSIFQTAGTDLAILHCSSEYPTEDMGANLQLISTLANRYGQIVGFSGHELGTLHSILALGMGAKIIERHVTLNNSLEGFDHKMSMNIESFKLFVGEIRRVPIVLGDGVKRITEVEELTRAKYRVSMVSSRYIEQGEVLKEDMIVYKNPGIGLPALEEDKFIGKIVSQAIPEDTLILPDFFKI
jgi:sialic acid synthase SpsE